jgi:hypothetical protein
VSYLEAPLPDPEKIPIGQDLFRVLVRNIPDDDYCTQDDVLLVFRLVDTTDPLVASDSRPFAFVNAVTSALSTSGPEENFISAWDRNIRVTLEQCVPSGTSMRNGNQTRDLRPDYGFLIRKMCPFRREEKSPDDAADPRREWQTSLHGCSILLLTYSVRQPAFAWCCSLMVTNSSLLCHTAFCHTCGISSPS